ncbi:alkaline phosphatase family protein [Lacipirellula limnantheis]|uniref:Type I phosphodiesterase / nucleotide pyrophosphatase n=1 Tax=Lacipirellula limnantheis TaxID=2528024 RepID=A0A517U0E8_9BACT|nr:alkaline phosphatase family protein [Lacipirellula limnantheis]QDT74107.1 Type I phosphodiesterase / nucleotide pyrophosphatase [Lacipirellula limnantheis]
MGRVFIVGWDGATFDLIEPWIAEGKLPNIAEVWNGGSHGELQSTLPPMTFPAWTSFMTGKNPGKHGIYDFTRQRPGTYDLEFVNGGQRKAPTFWKLLSDAGKRVISISVPCTFPPEPINGVMLSGFDAAGLGGSSSKLDARGMYPREVYDELERELDGHPIGSFPIQEINQGRAEAAVQKILDVIGRKAATAKYLMQSREWDCAMILFGESDGAGHHFWKYCDHRSPQFTPAPASMRDSILRVYQELDRQLGELKQLLPYDTTLLMMSDHGFGGVSNTVIYPNCWLREQNVLQFRGGFSKWVSRRLDALKLFAVAALPNSVQKFLSRFARTQLGGIEAKVRYGIIDWSETQAYFEENPYYPALRINLKGRQPQGTVEPGEEYEELRSELIRRLEEWRHPATGERIVEKAYRREEVYDGGSLDEAPDIVVKWATHEEYTYAFRVSSKSQSLHWMEELDPRREDNMAFFSGKSGSHRDNGIFLAEGPEVIAGKAISGARIIDMAPTILHLLGVPTPADMDGRALIEVLEGEAASPLEIGAAAGVVAEPDEAGTYTEEDKVVINERLRALGYID